MATFRSAEEQTKWDALAKSEKASWDRIKNGAGTQQDFKAISQLVGRQQTLASTIFTRAIQSIETAADARVKSITEHREKKGKPPLDEQQAQRLIEKAIQHGWDDQGPELVVVIEESVIKALDKQTKTIRDLFDAATKEQIKSAEEATQSIIQKAKGPGAPKGLADALKAEGITLPPLRNRADIQARAGVNKLLQEYMGLQIPGYRPGTASKYPSKLASQYSGLGSARITPNNPVANVQAITGQAQAQADQGTTANGETASTVQKKIEENIDLENEALKDLTDPQKRLKQNKKDSEGWLKGVWSKLRSFLSLNNESKGGAKSGAHGLLGGLLGIAGMLGINALTGGTALTSLYNFLSSQGLKDHAQEFVDYLETDLKKLMADIPTYIENAIKNALGIQSVAPTTDQTTAQALAFDPKTDLTSNYLRTGKFDSNADLQGVDKDMSKINGVQSSLATALGVAKDQAAKNPDDVNARKKVQDYQSKLDQVTKLKKQFMKDLGDVSDYLGTPLPMTDDFKTQRQVKGALNAGRLGDQDLAAPGTSTGSIGSPSSSSVGPASGSSYAASTGSSIPLDQQASSITATNGSGGQTTIVVPTNSGASTNSGAPQGGGNTGMSLATMPGHSTAVSPTLPLINSQTIYGTGGH